LIAPTSGKFVVGEGDIGANEYVILYPKSIPYLDAALYRDVVTNNHVIFDEGMVTDVTVAPNHGVGKHMSEGPDPGSRADL
jgi:hypothetical protein